MISFKQYLEEQASKTAVLSFGRLAPPTLGHAKLIDANLKQHGDGKS
jgi:hypothetical protein